MFSDDLTRTRKRHHLTQQDLALETGVSFKHIDNLEAGRRPVTIPIFRKLDKRLHFSLKVILEIMRGPADSDLEGVTWASVLLLVGLCV